MARGSRQEADERARCQAMRGSARDLPPLRHATENLPSGFCARRNSGFVAAALVGTLDVGLLLRPRISVRAGAWFESDVWLWVRTGIGSRRGKDPRRDGTRCFIENRRRIVPHVGPLPEYRASVTRDGETKRGCPVGRVTLFH